MPGLLPRPNLEVNATLREYFLHRLDELVDERIKILSGRANLAHTQVQGIVQVLLVVGACVEVHGEQVLRRHSGAGGVQLQLADGNSGAVCAKASEAKDAAPTRNEYEAHIFLGPVFQSLLHFAAARDR